MYESPISVFETVDSMATSIRKEKENYIYERVCKVGVDVNKEELMKALQYDRNQYEKGYTDGKCLQEEELLKFAEFIAHYCTHGEICIMGSRSSCEKEKSLARLWVNMYRDYIKKGEQNGLHTNKI